MEIIKNIIELIFSLALFINALLFIPQAIKIFKDKTSKGLSLLTFVGFLLIQFAVVLHGLINQDYILVIGYLLSMVTCGAVVILALRYKHQNLASTEVISLEEVLEQMPGHVYWKNIEGVNLGSNTNNWKDINVRSYYEYKGTTDYELFSKEYADNLRQADQEAIHTGKLQILEEGVDVSSEPGKLYLSYKAPLRNRNGVIIGVIGNSLDITDAKKEEIERLAFLENIIALLPGHVYWVSRDGTYLGCNDNQAKSAGLGSRKEIVGKKNSELPWNFNAGVLPETLDKINQEVMKTGKTIMLEEPALLDDDKKAMFLSSKAPIYNSKNEIIGMVGISIDITKQKQAEKELLETQHKLEGMTLVSASTAHELRTPLAGLNIGVSTLKNTLPQLVDAYKLAKEAKLSVSHLSPNFPDLLLKSIDAMQREISASLTFIDMMLINLKPEIKSDKTKVFSINHCVDEALSRYPFMPDQDKMVQWEKDKNQDFKVAGDNLLVIHVLFNLLKNAIYYVTKAGKGNIQIWISQHKLYFKDTGTGISADFLPHVFDRFFSKTRHGAGVGLTFCKMVMENLGGSIICESVEGDYTLFVLEFPNMP